MASVSQTGANLAALFARLGRGLGIGASKKTLAAAFEEQTLVPNGHRLLEGRWLTLRCRFWVLLGPFGFSYFEGNGSTTVKLN